MKDLNRLLYDQTKHNEHKHFCERCLHGYSQEDLLQRHIPECKGIGDRAVRIEMPIRGKNDILKFINSHKMMKVPFVIYADFEAIIKKIDDCSKTSTNQRARGLRVFVHSRWIRRSISTAEDRGEGN